MRGFYSNRLAGALLLTIATLGSSLAGQTPSATMPPLTQASPGPSGSLASRNVPSGSSGTSAAVPTNQPATSPQPLFDFKSSDIKFSLESLMRTLRDSRHEGWVLAAYPDPKTSRPLIGAGFSLDVEAAEHPQRDPLNPNPFLEPSSAQLWQAAGLDPQRLDKILDQFDRDLQAWKKKNYRRKIRAHTLTPELTENEATDLLRISAVQAIHNAKAYCRAFDHLTPSQQMALSQLVFQMGVNLEEFEQFLAALNNAPSPENASLLATSSEGAHSQWQTVQQALIESQWARRYSTRAITVIAMFDPSYESDPLGAERRVRAVLRPPVKHRHKKPRVESVRAGNDGSHANKLPHNTVPRSE